MMDSDVTVHTRDGRAMPLPIQMQPGFSAEALPGHVDIWCEDEIQNAYGEDFGFPNGISLDTPERKTELAIAIDLWAARAVSEFHEILEFTLLDGERLADPHPGGVDSPEEGEMWEWLFNRVRRLATDYIRRYPAK